MPLDNLKTPPIAVGRFEGDRFVADAETFENFAVYYSAYMIDNQKKNREQFQDNFLRRSPRIAKQKFSDQDDKPEKPVVKKYRRLSVVASDSEPVAVAPVMQMTELKRKRKSDLATVMCKKSKMESDDKASDISVEKRRQTVKKLFGMPRRGQRRMGIDQRPPELDNFDDDWEENSTQEQIGESPGTANVCEVTPQVCENQPIESLVQSPGCSTAIQNEAEIPGGELEPELHQAAGDYDQDFHLDYLKETEKLVDQANHNLAESPESPNPVPDKLFDVIRENLKTPPSYPHQVVQKARVSNFICDISDNSETLSTAAFSDESIEISSHQIGSTELSETPGFNHFRSEMEGPVHELPFETENLSVISSADAISSASQQSFSVEEKACKEDENIQEPSLKAQDHSAVFVEDVSSSPSQQSSLVEEKAKNTQESSFEAQAHSMIFVEDVSSSSSLPNSSDEEQSAKEDQNMQMNNPDMPFKAQDHSVVFVEDVSSSLSQQNSSVQEKAKDMQKDNQESSSSPSLPNSADEEQSPKDGENIQMNNPETSLKAQDQSVVLVKDLGSSLSQQNSLVEEKAKNTQESSFDAQDHSMIFVEDVRSSPLQPNSLDEEQSAKEDENVQINNPDMPFKVQDHSVVFVEDLSTSPLQQNSSVVEQTEKENENKQRDNHELPLEAQDHPMIFVEDPNFSTSQLVKEQDKNMQKENQELPFEAQDHSVISVEDVSSFPSLPKSADEEQSAKEDENMQMNNPEKPLKAQDHSVIFVEDVSSSPSQQNSSVEEKAKDMQKDKQESSFNAQAHSMIFFEDVSSSSSLPNSADDEQSPKEGGNIQMNNPETSLKAQDQSVVFVADVSSPPSQQNSLVEEKAKNTQESSFDAQAHSMIFVEDVSLSPPLPNSADEEQSAKEGENIQMNNPEMPLKARDQSVVLVKDLGSSLSQQNSSVEEQIEKEQSDNNGLPLDAQDHPMIFVEDANLSTLQLVKEQDKNMQKDNQELPFKVQDHSVVFVEDVSSSPSQQSSLVEQKAKNMQKDNQESSFGEQAHSMIFVEDVRSFPSQQNSSVEEKAKNTQKDKQKSCFDAQAHSMIFVENVRSFPSQENFSVEEQIGKENENKQRDVHELLFVAQDHPMILVEDLNMSTSPLIKVQDKNMQKNNQELPFAVQDHPMIFIVDRNLSTPHPEVQDEDMQRELPFDDQSVIFVGDVSPIEEEIRDGENRQVMFVEEVQQEAASQLLQRNTSSEKKYIKKDENMRRNNNLLPFEQQDLQMSFVEEPKPSFIRKKSKTRDESILQALRIRQVSHPIRPKSSPVESNPNNIPKRKRTLKKDQNMRRNNNRLPFEEQDRQMIFVEEPKPSTSFSSFMHQNPKTRDESIPKAVQIRQEVIAPKSSPVESNPSNSSDKKNENLRRNNNGVPFKPQDPEMIFVEEPKPSTSFSSFMHQNPKTRDESIPKPVQIRQEVITPKSSPVESNPSNSSDKKNENMRRNNNELPFEPKDPEMIFVEEPKPSTSFSAFIHKKSETREEGIPKTVQIRQEVITPESSHAESNPSSGSSTPAPPPDDNLFFEPQFQQQQQPRIFPDHPSFPTNPIPPPTHSSMRAPSLTPESPLYSPVPEMPQISQQAYNCHIEMHNLHPTAVQGGKFSDAELTNFENHFFGRPIYSSYCRRNFNWTQFPNKPGQPLLFPPVQLPSWFSPEQLSRHEATSRQVPPPMHHQFPPQPGVIPPPRHATVPRQPTAVPPWAQGPPPQPTEQSIPPWFNSSRPPQQEPRPGPQNFNLNGPPYPTSAGAQIPFPFNFNQNPNAPVDVPMPGVVPKPEEVYYPQQAYHQPGHACPPAHEMPVPDENLASIPSSAFPRGQIPCVPLPHPEKARVVTVNQEQPTIVREQYQIIDQDVEVPLNLNSDEGVLKINSSSDKKEGDRSGSAAKLAMEVSPDEEHQERLIRRHMEYQFIIFRAKQYGISRLEPIIPALICHRRARDISFYLQDRITMFFCRQYYHALTIKLLPMKFGPATLHPTHGRIGNSIRLRTDLMGGGGSGNEIDRSPSTPFDQLPYVVAQDDKNFYADPRTSIHYVINLNLDPIRILVKTDNQPASLSHQEAFLFLKFIPKLLRLRLMKRATLEEIP